MPKRAFLLAIQEAFPHTLPICLGYTLMGITWGILCKQDGHGLLFILGVSLFIYAGVVQFMLVALMEIKASLLNIFLLVLLVNVRQMCYAISMLEPFASMQKKRILYMAHTLSDETFMLLNLIKPQKSSSQDFMFAIALLNHVYWVFGCVAGGLLGGSFNLNVAGMSFIMVAIFVVIFIEQWKSTNRHASALIGLFSSIICFLLFGKAHFLLPTLILMGLIFLCFRRQFE
ncbi:AzlC family ABC transporter permease [Helicobacter suis]|uniref:AzlC family ABC transporter permease n=1 Tax=Helicobacter suis TaxID=104628 RepID=UPI002492B59F|nr:AzlC family ABC transporter permease [Helicobacter suis]